MKSWLNVWRALHLAMLLLACAMPRVVAAEALRLHATLEPIQPDEWHIAYEISPAVDALMFFRGNGDYRVGTWQLDDDFVIERVGGTDRIRRADGKPFRSVSARVTPTTTKPDAEYAPFLEFSDGGMVAYTGQFVMGVPTTKNADAFLNGINNDNAMAPLDPTVLVKPGYYGRMIVNAEVTNEPRELELAEGEYVYFGGASAIETANLTAVTDSQAPEWLREFLYESLSQTYDYYTYRLGELRGTRPFLVASFRPLDGRQVSFAGGVVKTQVIVDLGLGDEVPDRPETREFMINFFAHESAHLWHTGSGGVRAGGAGSWTHEGGADAKAWLALVELDIFEPRVARDLFEEAANECAAYLDVGTLAEVETRGEFEAYYDCGATIGLATHGMMRGVGRDLFDFWRALLKSNPGADDFRVDYYYLQAGRIEPGFDAALIDFAEGAHESGAQAVMALLSAGKVDAEIDADGSIELARLP